MKYLTFLILGYLAYHYFFIPKKIQQRPSKQPIDRKSKPQNSSNDGEYIDYEEVE